MLANQALVARTTGWITVLTNFSSRKHECSSREDARQSQIANPIGPWEVLLTLEHRGNSSPAHEGGNPGQTQLHPCVPCRTALSTPTLSVTVCPEAVAAPLGTAIPHAPQSVMGLLF